MKGGASRVAAKSSRCFRTSPRSVKLGVTACLTLLVSTGTAFGHHLEVSRLELRPESAGNLRGRLFLGPELPRPLGPSPELALAELVRRDLHFSWGRLECPLTARVLEVWQTNSPSPGHLIDVSCSAARTAHEPLTVRAAEGLGKLWVVYPAETAPGGPAERQELLEPPGELSVALLHLESPGRADAVPQPLEKTSVPEEPALPLGSAPGRAAPSLEPPLRPRPRELLKLGFEHVMPEGLDHVLFVASLALAAFRQLRALGLAVLAFTICHALGLSLGVLGVIDLPPGVLEPLIALSIVVLAALATYREAQGLRRKGSRLSRKAGEPVAHPAPRWPLSALFGVLHGLGFSQAFSALGLSGRELALGLVEFHLGIEAAHLAVLTGAWLLYRVVTPPLARWTHIREPQFLLSYGAALFAAGVGLLVERLSALT